jgi:hypothetical protein
MKNKLLAILFSSAVITSCISCSKDDKPATDGNTNITVFKPLNVSKSNSINIFAHYMPWFESPETSDNKKWGQHWTMSTMDPDKIDNNGHREIASWFYPLIEPYASSDPDVIEYHLLLMKYSGIDGILIDWYGTTELFDYPANNKNTEALIKQLDKVGLQYAIVYEDRTVKAALDNNISTDGIELAKSDLSYVESTFWKSENYIKINNKPLFMVFGPEYFHKPDDWQQIFSDISITPCFLTLYGKSSETSPSSSGEYIWVDAGSMADKYKSKSKFENFMGGAYPGFKDFYKQGGWGNGYNLPYDHNNGHLFRDNLNLAKDAGIDYLQLITWNDFGEGTMIEPTVEFGYTFLEDVQEFAGLGYTKKELESIYNLYTLRKTKKSDKTAQLSLEQAFYYLVSLQVDKATNIIDSLKNGN